VQLFDWPISFFAERNSLSRFLHDVRQSDVVLQSGEVAFQSRAEVVKDSLNMIGQKCTVPIDYSVSARTFHG
jgi:hypothetical protein